MKATQQMFDDFERLFGTSLSRFLRRAGPDILFSAAEFEVWLSPGEESPGQVVLDRYGQEAADLLSQLLSCVF
jgi:hypothetical protein